MTTTATRETKAYSTHLVLTPRLWARAGFTAVSSSLLYRSAQAPTPKGRASSSHSKSPSGTDTMSPASRAEYLAKLPFRDRISRPAAMPVEEKTLMMVSADAPPVRLMREIITAQSTPKMIMLISWL